MIGSLLSNSSLGNAISVPGKTASSPSKKRILCCAPSNAACDEMIRRLRLGIPDYHGKKRFIPKLVRLGTSCHEDVKDVTLEALVDEQFLSEKGFEDAKNMTISASENEKSLKKSIDILTAQRDAFNQRLIACSDSLEIAEISGKLRDVNDQRKDQLKSLYSEKEKKTDGKKNLDNVKLKVKRRILAECDIICCTLSSAGHDTLLNAKLGMT